MKIITDFNDFIENLLEGGFTLGGANGEGVFSLCSYFGEEIQWHTEKWKPILGNGVCAC